MFEGLRHAHSGIRWILLALLVSVIINAILSISSSKKNNIALVKYTFIAAHTQLLLGLYLFFTSDKVIFAGESMKEAISRFYLVEHSVGMLIAIILISLGYFKVKKIIKEKAAKLTLIYFGLALAIILFSIPWDTIKYQSNLF